MNGRALYEEHCKAADAVRLCHLERLRDIGISYAALSVLNAVEPTIGVAPVKAQSDGLFEFADDGEPMVIQAICVHPDERDVGDPGIIDLLAWSTSEPGRWWWRCGSAFALGWEMLEWVLEPEWSLPVVATPAEWLARSGDALCILDWSRSSPVWPLLRHGPPLTFSSNALRLNVRNKLILSAPLPAMETHNAA